MKEFRKEIPVFFSADENYVPFLATSIESIKEHANSENLYSIYILSDGFAKNTEEKLKSLETENLKVNFSDVLSKIKDIKEELRISLRDYYTISIFYRIFIASLYPQYDKAIYLDSDLVLLTDVANLYDIDIEGKILGVCVDQVVSVTEAFKIYTDKALGILQKDYFNSGVLLMNLKEFRAKKIEEKFLHLLLKYNFESVAPDQDYLNVLCKGNVKYLDKTWNVMPTGEHIDEDKINLIHYNMFNKPWKYDGVQYEKYFWYYANKTEYLERLKNFKANYSDEQKKIDMAGGETLIKNSLRISKSNITFKNILPNEDLESI